VLVQAPDDRHLDHGREMGIVMSISFSIFGIPQCSPLGCVIEPKKLARLLWEGMIGG
jgi:hypothetical protein